MDDVAGVAGELPVREDEVLESHNGWKLYEIAAYYGPEQPRIRSEVLGQWLICSLVPLSRSLAPHYSLHSRAPLRSIICSLARPLDRKKVDDKMTISSNFFSVLDHSAMG